MSWLAIGKYGHHIDREFELCLAAVTWALKKDESRIKTYHKFATEKLIKCRKDWGFSHGCKYANDAWLSKHLSGSTLGNHDRDHRYFSSSKSLTQLQHGSGTRAIRKGTPQYSKAKANHLEMYPVDTKQSLATSSYKTSGSLPSLLSSRAETLLHVSECFRDLKPLAKCEVMWQSGSVQRWEEKGKNTIETKRKK